MADERDLELLDDYLTNRLSEQDRSAFEQRLKADPDLQHEYALQKRLIQGIRDARLAELKAMLNNVAIPGGGSGNTLSTKIMLGTAAGLIIAAAALWYFTRDHIPVPEQKTTTQEQTQTESPAEPEVKAETKSEQRESTTPERPAVETDKNQTSAGTEHSKPSLAKKPDPLAAPDAKDENKADRDGPVLDVFAPENEENNDRENNRDGERRTLTPRKSSLAVETDKTNRRYTFHYQFRDGKLFLFGPFEKDLYEILEFFTDEKRTVFLFYKEQYYLLNEADNQIRPLTPITDPALINKLKEYRRGK